MKNTVQDERVATHSRISSYNLSQRLPQTLKSTAVFTGNGLYHSGLLQERETPRNPQKYFFFGKLSKEKEEFQETLGLAAPSWRPHPKGLVPSCLEVMFLAEAKQATGAPRGQTGGADSATGQHVTKASHLFTTGLFQKILLFIKLLILYMFMIMDSTSSQGGRLAKRFRS